MIALLSFDRNELIMEGDEFAHNHYPAIANTLIIRLS